MKVDTLIEQFRFDTVKLNSYIYDVIKQNYALNVKLSRLAFRTLGRKSEYLDRGAAVFATKHQRTSVTNLSRTK